MSTNKKTIINFIAVICIAITTVSCSKNSSFLNPSSDDSISIEDNLNKNTTSSNVATIAVNPSLLPGTWTVSYYFDKTNKTARFAGYTITMNANGTVSATQASTTTNGTWTTNASKSKLYFAFTGVKLLEEISEDWKIISQTSSKLELVNISGGNGGTDYLTLIK
ncbi:MAG: hypothetical protein R2831_06085 [Chitinophagaceae bacterium]